MPSDIAFTTAVKAAQTERGSRRAYANMESRGCWSDVVTQPLREFIAERDSFYLATASAQGQPYIQHRGGPRGFLKVLDDRTLAFADYAGNQQYISFGNLSENNKAFIFLMDYPNRTRIKLWGDRVRRGRPRTPESARGPELQGPSATRPRFSSQGMGRQLQPAHSATLRRRPRFAGSTEPSSTCRKSRRSVASSGG